MTGAGQTQREVGRALTLIELLAVIVVASLVAGVATVGLAASGESARLHGAAAQWRDLDARARLLGRSLGPVRISVDRGVVRLHVIETNELISSVALPGGISLDTSPIEFDRLGRSIDYRVDLHGANRAIRWRICGLTGYVIEAEP